MITSDKEFKHIRNDKIVRNLCELGSRPIIHAQIGSFGAGPNLKFYLASLQKGYNIGKDVSLIGDA